MEVDCLVIGTLGYDFTFRVVSVLTGVNIGACVHYPTISNVVVHRVGRDPHVVSHNNSTFVSSSMFLTRGNLLQVPVFVIRFREHDINICFATGTIVSSRYPTHYVSEKPLSWYYIFTIDVQRKMEPDPNEFTTRYV